LGAGPGRDGLVLRRSLAGPVNPFGRPVLRPEGEQNLMKKIPMTAPRARAALAATVTVLAVALAGGVAVAAGADDWYTGGNATVPDHDDTGVGLQLYDASGAKVTSGSTTTPIAAFAAASGVVRSGDQYASLFVHLAESDTAPGAWPGVQVTGTDKYDGSGSVSAPGALTGKPYVRTTADGYTLADVAAALPNSETSATFAGVYELRLRTSSATSGVSTEYAATYVKITGSTWKITDAPVLGDGSEAVSTTTKAKWPSKLTVGKSATVKATVTASSGSAKPSGTVRLVSGSKTLATAKLTNGTATLTVAKVKLKPGKQSLQVVYVGVTDRFSPSASPVKKLTVKKKKPTK
jgi:hypothetical protein